MPSWNEELGHLTDWTTQAPCICGYLKKKKKLFWGKYKSGRGMEREAQDLKLALTWQAYSGDPDVGLKLRNHDIITWTGVWRSTNWAIQVSLCGYF